MCIGLVHRNDAINEKKTHPKKLHSFSYTALYRCSEGKIHAPRIENNNNV